MDLALTVIPMRLVISTALFCLAATLAAAAPARAQTGGMLSAPDDAKGTVEPLPASPAARPASTLSVPSVQTAPRPVSPTVAIPASPAANPASTLSAPAVTTVSAGTRPLSANDPAFAIPGMADKQDEKTEDDKDPLKNPIFLGLMPAMQDEIMTEAANYNRDCKVRVSYAVMHDCDCLSLHYMNERIRHPDSNGTDIMNTIALHCVNKPSTAGYSYNKCVSLYAMAYPQTYKQLCECYARDFTKAYAEQPNTTAQYEIYLGVKTLESCRDRLKSMIPDSKLPGAQLAPLPATTP